MGNNPDPDDLLALYAELEAEAGPPQERRLHPRTAARGHVPATLELAPGGAAAAAPLAVAIRDMSRSGVGVFAPRPLPVGATAVLGFRLRGGPVRATCRVANCREDESGRYVVGLALTEVRRQQPAAAPVPLPPEASSSSPPPGEPEGAILSGQEAMAGAEIGAVSDVVQRLAKLLAQS